MNGVDIYPMLFSVSIAMIMWVLSFLLLITVYHIRLCILNHPCDPGMNLVWSWSLMCLDLVC